MLTPSAIDDLAAEVARLNGIPLVDAERFVVLVGDTPELDSEGNIIVSADGLELARLAWPVEG